MLDFVRGYCRDLLDDDDDDDEDYDNDENDDEDRRRRRRRRRRRDDAIVRAYATAISSIAGPPRRGRGTTGCAGGSSSSSSSRSYYSSTEEKKYRTGKFLLSLVDEMEVECRVRPNSYVLSAVLLGVDDASESMNILDEFERRYGGYDDDDVVVVTVEVYNVAISRCLRGMREHGWQKALSILGRMRRAGPEPNEMTYSHVIGACASGGQSNVAFSLLDEVRRSCRLRDDGDGDGDGVRPPAITAGLYLPLLRACADSGDHARVGSIVDMMREDSLAVSTEIINSYLLSLARGGLHARASSVLDGMIADGPSSSSSSSTTALPRCRPDVVSYNTVLLAHANAGDYDGARDLLDRMASGDRGDVRPDVASYNTVISCACPLDALSLIREMRLTRRNRDGVVMPNSVTYVNAIVRCRKATIDGDDPDSAFEIALHLLDMAREEDDGGGIDINVFVYSASIWMDKADPLI
ncbi:hypothetical protein ACHAW5_006528 [Stephanodiscus triporus]|uniref:Pentacotripeptide-repeat region of PRORP domain-containing protein n=1 Tax=Stephanodiscus triporus TaxID=2934178 RepID=A0ABD3PNL1_9STRA